MSKKIFQLNGALHLESGEVLNDVQIAYHSYGELNASGDNVIWVCHALTANSDVFDWWSGLFGESQLYNPQEHFIVCANILGSPYGTTNPLSRNPESDKSYYLDFPQITVRDVVSLHQSLRIHLGITQFHTLIGASIGGHQALEWAIMEPGLMEHLVLLGTNAVHSPWGIAFNESQRMAIEADGSWGRGSKDDARAGLEAARSIGLLSYRNAKAYDRTQRDEPRRLGNYNASSYQRYQGQKLSRRFDAYSYWYLTHLMDSHDVGRDRGDIRHALSRVRARTLIFSFEGDYLFSQAENQLLADHIAGARLITMATDFGHDGFLIETDALTISLRAFYKSYSMNQQKINKSTGIGLIGYGVVGQAVYDQLRDRRDVRVTAVAVKDLTKDRNGLLQPALGSAYELISRDDVDIIIELIDDSEEAYHYVKSALLQGKSVITANKKMLAYHLPELEAIATRNNISLRYEASVAGAIPILDTLDRHFSQQSINSIQGIVNGSTNYILSSMRLESMSYEEALLKAQQLGFAESDPRLDVDGYDALYKAVILCYKAYGHYISPEQVSRDGIAKISKHDLGAAELNGERIKLLATVERSSQGVNIEVRPTNIPLTHPLASVEYETNAVMINTAQSDTTVLIGKGAGGQPTASSVISDLQKILSEKSEVGAQTEKVQPDLVAI